MLQLLVGEPAPAQIKLVEVTVTVFGLNSDL